MKRHVNVLGVGMTQFKTPKNADPYTVMGAVNPSGDLIAKGHPLGATGLAQCAELNWHLRDEAGERQVEGALIALQHNIGLGGCCVVTLYERTA